MANHVIPFASDFRRIPKQLLLLGGYAGVPLDRMCSYAAPSSWTSGKEFGPVTRSKLALSCWPNLDICGITRFRNARQDAAQAAEAVALYRGIDSSGDDDIEIVPTISLSEAVLQRVDNLMGARKHNAKHRAANKFAQLAKVIKVLTDELKFEAPFTFTNSPADLRALGVAAKGIVKGALENGVEVPNGEGGVSLIRISKGQRNNLRKGIECAYFIRTEMDDFYEKLAQCGLAPLE